MSFIHDGDPNNHGQIDVPEWPEYSSSNGGEAVNGFGEYVKTFVFQANEQVLMLRTILIGHRVLLLSSLCGEDSLGIDRDHGGRGS